jgi:hypothetical protein
LLHHAQNADYAELKTAFRGMNLTTPVLNNATKSFDSVAEGLASVSLEEADEKSI